MKNMTKAQAELLAKVRESGELTRNGRAGQTIRTLAARGLVTFEFELVPHDDGRMTERYTVRPTHQVDRTFDPWFDKSWL